MPESALIVAVPEAEMCVGSLRQRFDTTARLGVPAHITVLYPFMSPALIDRAVLSEVRLALAEATSFAFSLARVERFPNATYLAPEPVAPFVRLTESLVRRFPQFPPFGGRFDSIVPHLTVAHGTASDVALVESELTEAMRSSGPIQSLCRSVLLIENSPGVWRTMHSFPLANP